MQQHKNVKTVLDKGTPRKGEFRIRNMKIISGNKNTDVVQMENGCRLMMDPRKVYFSQREGTERQRIFQLVRPEETVMVFFAGAGPFAVQIAKKVKNVIGVEKNPYGIKYFRKNIALNKLQNTTAVLGDVKTKAKKYYGKCDRVLMPLPETAIDYIDYAVGCLKDTGFIHLYFFCNEENLEKKKEEIIGKINAHCTLNVHKVLPYGPKIWKYRADIHVSKR